LETAIADSLNRSDPIGGTTPRDRGREESCCTSVKRNYRQGFINGILDPYDHEGFRWLDPLCRFFF
jgi:hypothetical protein